MQTCVGPGRHRWSYSGHEAAFGGDLATIPAESEVSCIGYRPAKELHQSEVTETEIGELTSEFIGKLSEARRSFATAQVWIELPLSRLTHRS